LRRCCAGCIKAPSQLPFIPEVAEQFAASRLVATASFSLTVWKNCLSIDVLAASLAYLRERLVLWLIHHLLPAPAQ
jgi:hypothetical protein